MVVTAGAQVAAALANAHAHGVVHAFEAWELTFDLPGDQRLAGGTGGNWSQHGQTVTARSVDGAALAAGGTAQFDYSARYRGTNPMPVTFALNGSHCNAALLGTSVVTQAGGSGAGSGRDQGRGNGNSNGEGKDENKNGDD